MKRIVILLPAWNEKKNLEKFIDEVLSQEKLSPGWEYKILVVVDERSNDGTKEMVDSLARKNPKINTITVSPGLGTALIEGHLYSIKNLKPDLLAQLDGDGQVDANVLPKLISAIDEGYTLAIGSRFAPGGENRLSFSRKLFSKGASLFFRILVGPFDIQEITNSARAFTPELFKKVNLARLPWKEKTFIIQPAFLNEAILAGAKYKEVPLIFKNRAEGYSKNKVLNYTYDVITYSLDARFKKWGIPFELFKYTRKIKTIIKFSMVGISGTIVDFIFYNIFISTLGFRPATSKGFSTEIAIINNFAWNNTWTFKHRKTKSNLWQKFLIFNLVSLGGLSMGVLIVKFLHIVYGDGFVNIYGVNVPYYNLYFFATIAPVMIWNFIINHFITWKHQKE